MVIESIATVRNTLTIKENNATLPKKPFQATMDQYSDARRT
jgi:hypothetical protein